MGVQKPNAFGHPSPNPNGQSSTVTDFAIQLSGLIIGMLGHPTPVLLPGKKDAKIGSASHTSGKGVPKYDWRGIPPYRAFPNPFPTLAQADSRIRREAA
jgi:hypothetical protein